LFYLVSDGIDVVDGGIIVAAIVSEKDKGPGSDDH
jgi:hypothetical protein